MVDDWRAILSDHARHVRDAAMAGAPASGAAVFGAQALSQLRSALGPSAEEAVQIVEDFAIGSAAKNGTKPPADSAERFGTRLAIVLNGIEPLKLAAAGVSEGQPQIIQSQLWQLLQMVRESADISYAREIKLVELDRRILLMLSDEGALVPAQLSGAAGVDKAQVSRSVKRLLELRLVERDQIRAPVGLTRKGQVVSDRLNKLAELRNRELTLGIDEDRLDSFMKVVSTLLRRAVTLYEQERDHGTAPDASAEAKFDMLIEIGSAMEKLARNSRRIIAPLLTLSAYFSRSGSLTFKRLTRLSSFEAQVLNEIGMDPPIEWSRLVTRIDRDHSQAARTVNGLIERGLVARHGKPGRRHGRFSPTAEGAGLFEIIQQAGRQRNDFLLAPLAPEERTEFLATFALLLRNAEVQLERERAYEEMDRD